jgi:hypothetical protein
MTIIETRHGDMDPEKLPEQYEPANCGLCGFRIGWVNTDYLSDTLVALCDDCATLVTQGQETAP